MHSAQTIKRRFIIGYLAALTVVSVLLFYPARATEEAPREASTYAAALEVIEIDGAGDPHTVTAITPEGHAFSFFVDARSDLRPGDMIAAAMDDAGTPEDVTDDAITDCSRVPER